MSALVEPAEDRTITFGISILIQRGRAGKIVLLSMSLASVAGHPPALVLVEFIGLGVFMAPIMPQITPAKVPLPSASFMWLNPAT